MRSAREMNIEMLKDDPEFMDAFFKEAMATLDTDLPTAKLMLNSIMTAVVRQRYDVIKVVGREENIAKEIAERLKFKRTDSEIVLAWLKMSQRLQALGKKIEGNK